MTAVVLRAWLHQLATLYGVGPEVRALLADKPDPVITSTPFGQLLRRTRERNDDTIDGIQDRANISRSQLSFYEQGRQKNPGIRTMLKLSLAYELPFLLILHAALHEAGLFDRALVAPRVRQRTRVQSPDK